MHGKNSSKYALSERTVPDMAKCVTAAQDLLIHIFDDEMVILNLKNEKYYTLNDIGLRMWQVLTDGSSVDEATQVLMNEYDVEEQRLCEDLEKFIQHLRDLALVDVHED